jgi:hypothetical protein
MIEKMHRNLALAVGVAALATVVPLANAQAAEPATAAAPAAAPGQPRDRDFAPKRQGFQIDGLIGGSGCIPGPAPCRYDSSTFSGKTMPSFGTGITLGWRATRWFLLGGMYRLGVLHPNYDGERSDYHYATVHTASLVLRPILPIWRFDLGLNVAPGYTRQLYRYGSSDGDWSEGFSMMVGPTIDFFVTERFFLGAEVDFVFSTQRWACMERGVSGDCGNDLAWQLAPTHQALYGLHIGGTIG